FGRPLYGDVFVDPDAAGAAVPVAASGPRRYWGDLEVLESSEDEDEDEDEDSEGADESDAGEDRPSGEAVQTEPTSAGPADAAATLTDDQLRSGLASMPSGLATPSVIQLRKPGNQSLYTVLPERETAQLEGIMGSQFTYDMSNALDPSKKQGTAGGRKAQADGVEITLDASELEGMDDTMLREKYDAAEAQRAPGEDLSDMVAEHVAAQARKRKPAAPASAAPKKKPKDFKF
ncbi:Splicing factor 3B subunit 2, partial [Coemansia spiralis]